MLKIRKPFITTIQNLLISILIITAIVLIRDIIVFDAVGHAAIEIIVIAGCIIAISVIYRERKLSELREELFGILDSTYLNGKTLRSVIESGFFTHYSKAGEEDFIHRALLALVMAIAVGPRYDSAPFLSFDSSYDLIFRNYCRSRSIRLMTRSTSPDYVDWLGYCQIYRVGTADDQFCIGNLWDFTTAIADFNALCHQKMQDPDTSYVLGEIISAYWLWSFANHTKHNFRDSDHDRKSIGLPATFRRDLEGPLHELGNELEKIHHTELITDLTN